LPERFELVHVPSRIAVARVTCARSWMARGIGVLGMAGLLEGEGIWLPGVASIHTCGVRFALDICFFDAAFRAIKLAAGVPPWRPLVRAAGASHVVELNGGAVARSGVEWRDGDPWSLLATEEH
jgi:hypothetical protein